MLERVESNIVEPSKQEDLTSNMDITPTDIGDIGIRAWWERWWRWRWWLWKLWCNEFTDSLAGGSILGAWTRGKTKHMWYELVTFSAFENILNIPNLHSYMILYFLSVSYEDGLLRPVVKQRFFGCSASIHVPSPTPTMFWMRSSDFFEIRYP